MSPRTDARSAAGSGLTGWRRNAAALVAGAVGTAALPPVEAVPLLFVAFPALLLLIGTAARVRSAFWIGWWFGFGHFVAGLYWLAWPLTLDIARFGWMIPFAVFGISAVMAVFPAIAAALARGLAPPGIARILVLAAAWAAMEWLRGHVASGFPWNLVASGWMAVEPLLQAASLLGAYGLGLVTVALAGAPALAFARGLSPLHRYGGMAAAAAILAGLWVWGAGRLAAAPAEAAVPGVQLRLVQGNVPQSLKWDESRRDDTFRRYLGLTRAAGFERVTHVVWPETAIDYRFVTDYPVVRIDGERLARLAAAVPAGGALITGAIRDRDRAWFNSVHVVGPGGQVRATYDKHHLVPFGEYVPLRGLLRSLGIEQIAHGAGDYSAGPGPVTLAVPGAPPAAPMICYEAIFPAAAAAAPRPGWLLNVTNDAWFGLTSGPYQHFAAARLRAVEAGLPLVRAANTGITAVIDAYGRVVARLPIETTGFLDSRLPPAIAEPTLYARMGDRVLVALLLAALLIASPATLRQLARRDGKSG